MALGIASIVSVTPPASSSRSRKDTVNTGTLNTSTKDESNRISIKDAKASIIIIGAYT